MTLHTPDETYDEIIEHKTMKLNGEVVYKRYGKRKFLGKGIWISYLKVDSPNAIKALIWKPKN